MQNLSYESLKRPSDLDFGGNRGSTDTGNVEMDGYFYHVITQSWRKETIFYSDVAKYRHDLLCKLCAERGITILFSVTMPNHTHDVLMGPSWDVISEMIRILDSQVSRYFRSKYPEKKKVFRRYPVYVIVKNIVVLFYLGKYGYDNPSVLKDKERGAPHSCFKSFESGKLQEPAYDKSIYQKLFGLTPEEIVEIYRTMTKEQVLEYAKNRFSDWTEERNKALFINKNYKRINKRRPKKKSRNGEHR